MKIWFPIVSLAVLLTACGGNAESPVDRAAPQAMRSATTLPFPAHTLADYSSLLQSFYMGFFGRPADTDGLAYWAKIASDSALPLSLSEWAAGYSSNADIKNILDALADSIESQNLYVSNNTSFINAVYQNGFNRNSDVGGRQYWADLIDRGLITRAQAVLSILDGAQGDDATVLGKKTQAASSFTSLLTTDQLNRAYGAGGYADVVRDFLATITASTDPAAVRADIAALVASLDVNGPAAATRRYAGYHYLQDMSNAPQYLATYRFTQSDVAALPVSGALTYGTEPQTLNWTRDAAGYSYAAPFIASVGLRPVVQLPALTMLCRPIVTVNGDVTKSTDVLVARSALQLTDAAALAGQRFTVYRENCATGGGHLSAISFDATGAGRFVSAGAC